MFWDGSYHCTESNVLFHKPTNSILAIIASSPPSVSGMSGVESIGHVTNAQPVVEVWKT